jgi:hypothetical protein
MTKEHYAGERVQIVGDPSSDMHPYAEGKTGTIRGRFPSRDPLFADAWLVKLDGEDERTYSSRYLIPEDQPSLEDVDF